MEIANRVGSPVDFTTKLEKTAIGVDNLLNKSLDSVVPGSNMPTLAQGIAAVKTAVNPKLNLGNMERVLSVAGGAALASQVIKGFSVKSPKSLLLGTLAGGLLYRGVSGYCAVYNSMGVNTQAPSQGNTIKQVLSEKVHQISDMATETASVISDKAEQLGQKFSNVTSQITDKAMELAEKGSNLISEKAENLNSTASNFDNKNTAAVSPSLSRDALL